MKPIIQNTEFSNHIGHCKNWRGEGHFPGMALLIQPLKLLKIKVCTKLQKYKQIKKQGTWNEKIISQLDFRGKTIKKMQLWIQDL